MYLKQVLVISSLEQILDRLKHFDNNAEVRPVHCVPVPAALQDLFVLRWAVLGHAPHVRSRVHVDDLRHDLVRSQALEGRFTRHDLPHHDAERVHISLVAVVRVALKDLGRHPMERACQTSHHTSRRHRVHLLNRAGKPEVCDLHLAMVIGALDLLGH